MLDVVMHLEWCSFSLPIACRDACSFLCWLQDTFLLPNLQTKSNDRMLVTRVQPGPFSGYDSATKGTAVGNNGLKWVLACASVSGPQNLSSILCKKKDDSRHIQQISHESHKRSICRYSMFHCHFLHHEDTGCAAVAQW